MESCCRLFHSVPFDLDATLLAEGDGASGFFLASFAVLAAVSALHPFIYAVFERLRLRASVNHSFFSHPDVSFPPAFLYVTPPFPPMHLGNQEMESDAEDEVNRTLPTPSCSAPHHASSILPALAALRTVWPISTFTCNKSL